jgi:hypothetical protein
LAKSLRIVPKGVPRHTGILACGGHEHIPDKDDIAYSARMRKAMKDALVRPSSHFTAAAELTDCEARQVH